MVSPLLPPDQGRQLRKFGSKSGEIEEKAGMGAPSPEQALTELRGIWRTTMNEAAIQLDRVCTAAAAASKYRLPGLKATGKT